MKMRFLKTLLLSFTLLGMMQSCSTQKYPTKRKSSYPSRTVRPQPKVPPKAAEVSPSKTVTKKVQTENRIEEEIIVALPEVKREFRAAWIASVANINWPSRRGMSPEEQKQEALDILNNLSDHNFNAVILQVRPSADALYESPYEPWSIFLTGENGVAPNPYYKPLEFWIEEAHKRGLELHVWLNPYRAHHTNGGRVGPHSMVRKMPEDIIRLRNGMHWFDPAKKSTQDHVSNVVRDLVQRFDIDGIHFDDYFYPYKSYNNGADFPDHASWQQYKSSGGTLSRAEWRRENVNSFIYRIYNEIKEEKDWVMFGISPFGIWKSGVPEGTRGMSQYDELYADAKLWLNKGWIDYFTPQLYWPVNASRQSFPVLLRWWESENTQRRHLWPGLNTVEVRAADRPAEILEEIRLTREILPAERTGEIHWSYAGLNPSMLTALKNGPYKEKALIPESPWMKALPLQKPEFFVDNLTNNTIVRWTLEEDSAVRNWILYLKYGDEWKTEILPSTSIFLPVQKIYNGKDLELVVLRGADRLGNLGPYAVRKVE